MQIDLTNREFRMLLDMVYLGNWILNSTRGDDRFAEYDDLESKLFTLCRSCGMDVLAADWENTVIPSRAYEQGGIQQVIAYYEDNVFFELLAEALSRRDMGYADITEDNYDEIVGRMQQYMQEFEISGIDHLTLEDSSFSSSSPAL